MSTRSLEFEAFTATLLGESFVGKSMQSLVDNLNKVGWDCVISCKVDTKGIIERINLACLRFVDEELPRLYNLITNGKLERQDGCVYIYSDEEYHRVMSEYL